jgi:hypothetical protein
MPVVGRAIPWLVLGFALLGLFLGFSEWANPPFSDEQLRASLTNTWEVHVSTTRVFLFVFLGLGAISFVLARRATDSATRIAGFLATAACLAVVLVFLRNHFALAERTTELTGQQVSLF